MSESKTAPVWALWRRPEYRWAFSLFILTRAVLLLVGWWGTMHIPSRHYVHHVSKILFVDIWMRWDSLWYMGIANHGYAYSKSAYAFFPLYPWLMGLLKGLWPHMVYIGGLIVSNLAFFGILVLIYLLAERLFTRRAAERTMLYLVLFPTAFYFSAVYTESLFLFCVLLALLWALEGRFLGAGVAASFAALTRNIGVGLALCIAIEGYAAFRSGRLKHWISAWPATLPVLTLLGYMAYLWRKTGDPLRFIHAQGHWSRHIVFPWTTVRLIIGHLTYYSFEKAHFYITVIDVSSFLLFALLIILGIRRKMPWSITVWGMISLVIPSLAPELHGVSPLTSMSRFVLVCVPGFLALGAAGERQSVDRAVTIVFPMLQTLFFLFFVMSLWLA